jgi:glycosyltransferase involved in cell wall biosynthesis
VQLRTLLRAFWYLILTNNLTMLFYTMGNNQLYDLIVFSQLRWQSVTQRPHHIMLRLARDYRILFIEEPAAPSDVYAAGHNRVENVAANITVMTPHMHWRDWPSMSREYVSILHDHVSNISECIGWFYSPVYVGIFESVNFRIVIYDCMDELSAFKDASPQLPEFEKVLLKKAHIVFTGGKSLFEAKTRLHHNVSCFPSSVDQAHFSRAKNTDLELPNDLPSGRPIVGYYGVIDERIDLGLIAHVSDAMPHVNFIMIGPFAKIDPGSISHPSNVHYLGKKDYAELPAYLKGFNVAMMPFALNESTKFISPTKTLEFMAAGKPVVSTPIYDVVRDYSDCVSIARNAEDFVAAIRDFLEESPASRSSREARYDLILRKTSWDSTVESMLEKIQTALAQTKAYPGAGQ